MSHRTETTTVLLFICISYSYCHDDVINWKHFPLYWPFVKTIHRSPVDFPHKGQWGGALIFSLSCVETNDWANNRDAGYLIRHCARCHVTVMLVVISLTIILFQIGKTQQQHKGHVISKSCTDHFARIRIRAKQLFATNIDCEGRNHLWNVFLRVRVRQSVIVLKSFFHNHNASTVSEVNSSVKALSNVYLFNLQKK